MEYSRKELLPGIFLTHLRSDKFKTACISLNLLTQLSRDSNPEPDRVVVCIQQFQFIFCQQRALPDFLQQTPECFGTVLCDAVIFNQFIRYGLIEWGIAQPFMKKLGKRPAIMDNVPFKQNILSLRDQLLIIVQTEPQFFFILTGGRDVHHRTAEQRGR